MKFSQLTHSVFMNVARNRSRVVLSVFGIIIGIAAFVFFLGLSAGVRNVVLGQLFPLEQVEVVAPRASLLGVDVTKQLDDSTVEAITQRPGVARVVPRMSMAFPAAGYGWFNGQTIHFEIGGFCDGIDASYITDPRLSELFQDWESETHRVQQQTCGPPPTNACSNPDRYYCDIRDGKCHHRVPVLISQTLLELYNSQFAQSHGLPQIGKLEQFIVQRGGLGQMRFFVELGGTMVTGSNANIDDSKKRRVEAFTIGVSDKAMPIGVTIPIEYVRRWNREFVGEKAAATYSSIVVHLEDKQQIAPFSKWLADSLGLTVKDHIGERLATAIFVVTMLFVLISVVIVSISALNIAHSLFMQVAERRREIGLLRAVGATRADVRNMIVGEAAVVGLFGGGIGVGLAMVGGLLVDWLSRRFLPRYPFEPETYFDFQGWILLGGIAFAILCCVLGGVFPARRAARMAPAQALA